MKLSSRFRCRQGMAPIHLAAINGHCSAIKCLVKHDAHVNIHTGEFKEYTRYQDIQIKIKSDAQRQNQGLGAHHRGCVLMLMCAFEFENTTLRYVNWVGWWWTLGVFDCINTYVSWLLSVLLHT